MRTMTRRATLAAAILLLTSAGCSSRHGTSGPAGGTTTLVAEGFCNLPDLARPLRDTFVLIDEAAVTRTNDATQFARDNAWLRDAVLGIADPEQAIASGASQPRERITIIGLAKDGSAGARLFTGCIPAMTTDEVTRASAQRSAVGDFFAGGVRQRMQSEVEVFRARLLGALQMAARGGADGGPPPGSLPLDRRSMLRSLRQSTGLLDAGSNVARLVIVSDFRGGLPGIGSGEPDARRGGFVAGRRSGMHLGGVDAVLLQHGDTDAAHEAFWSAFFLSQQANVVQQGGYRVSQLPPAPARVRRFMTQATFPDGPMPAQVRIGVAADGRLVGSWMTLRDQNDRAVPMDGRADCDAAGVCAVRASENRFAQDWSFAPGGEPEFDAQLPFGGLRSFALRIADGRLEGRVYDAMVATIGADQHDIPIAGSEQPGARF